MADPDTAIERLQEAVHQTPIRHPERAERLSEQGTELYHRYEQTQNTSDLEAALDRFLESMDLMVPDHQDLAERTQHFGNYHLDKYSQTGDPTHLAIATTFYGESAKQTLPENTERADRVQNLAVSYQWRYDVNGSVADLENACQFYEQSVEYTPVNHPARACRLYQLGCAYRTKFQETRNITYLGAAIRHTQDSVLLTENDDPEYGSRLWELGAGLYERYLEEHNPSDLGPAIQSFKNAINHTSSDDPERMRRLHYLGDLYRAKYDETFIKTDLDTAIEYTQQSVLQDHPEQNNRLRDLGYLFNERYSETDDFSDLEKATLSYQQVVDQMLPDDPEWPHRLYDLGDSYRAKYQAAKKLADLNLAIQNIQFSVDHTPLDDPTYRGRVSMLGTVYEIRSRHTQSSSDLKVALRLHEEAIDQLSAGDAARAVELHVLGSRYHDKYIVSKSPEDLATAIRFLERSIDETASDAHGRAFILQHLGDAYHDRHLRTGGQKDLETAICHYQSAIDHPSSYVFNRVMAVLPLLPLYANAGSRKDAYKAAKTVMQLMPSFAPRFFEHGEKLSLLPRITGLASDSAAIALNAGADAFSAVQLLELGRAIVSGSLSDMRADTADLLSCHPDLGQEYIRLLNELDSPRDSYVKLHGKSAKSSRAIARMNASKEMDRLLPKIAGLSGFRNFLLTPQKEDMQAAAKHGPIIILNVSQYRCDAILIEQHDIRYLALPNLSSEDIKEKARGSDLSSPETLEWMWHTIAKPVLNALGLTQTPSDNRWPHVWWIPTSYLSKFPLHAAGIHSDTSCESVLDRVMSSYGVSIKAILHGRAALRPDLRPSETSQALLVAIPNAPGSRPLPFALEEVEIVHKLCEKIGLKPIQPGQRKADIIPHLSKCKIFHFAGHGFTDSYNAGKSYLLLNDGQTKPLNVTNLLEMNIGREHLPLLAYLSACGTGQIHNDKLLDESIHLIRSFQLAGFRHVIGTLWEVNDEVCVDVARITYQCLLDENLTDESVCLGLHNAIRKLRDEWLFAKAAERGRTRDHRLPRDALVCEEDDNEGSLSWVPYVHFGV
ncbi:hypothetical protein CC86DRAFT_457554 [Ophiobolus disseminans]|uniref:CHAT domain-containing protein n=1 Tax=Ophiobolus disseminans TaxID=1469910 RepID=A0A6A6ZT45_9PLEO|nr:hypothetical protein CC86DRAFT_457554 [Ophiobolus disseminans]